MPFLYYLYCLKNEAPRSRAARYLKRNSSEAEYPPFVPLSAGLRRGYSPRLAYSAEAATSAAKAGHPRSRAAGYSAKENKTRGSFSLKGIGGKKILAFPYKDIEAVITEVDSKEFEPEKIKLKLEDLKWTEEKVRNHQKVIEEAMKDSPVIPLKFLTLYKSQKRLLDVLKKDYLKFRELLDTLKEKTEWGLKIYLADKEKLAGIIKKEDEEIASMQKELSVKPEGARYFLEKKIDERTSGKIAEELDKYLKEIFEVFKPFSVQAPVINKLLPQEATPKGEMILNASYLIINEKIGEFNRAVKRIHNLYFPKGLWVESNGPWPPYNFVTNNEL